MLIPIADRALEDTAAAAKAATLALLLGGTALELSNPASHTACQSFINRRRVFQTTEEHRAESFLLRI